MNDTITFMIDAYRNEKSGEEVPGVTVIIDGKLRQVMDIMIEKCDVYENYMDVARTAFCVGLEQIANPLLKKKNQ